MNYADGITKLAEYRKKISAIRTEMLSLQATIDCQEVEDYTFQTAEGEVRLRELFGENEQLFIIHNMGSSCPYCTLWADGFNGIYDHIKSRAAFFLSSPDSAERQGGFARSRGWRFPMISHQGTAFAADMGYTSDAGYLPGISTFKLDSGRPVRLSDAAFGPGDDFSPFWHLFDLLPGPADDWRPKFDYGDDAHQAVSP